MSEATADLPRRALGRSGLEAPALGLGAGRLGDPALDEREVARLLHGALDLGVTLIDTAPSYGLSEERIGRHLAGRRGELLLSTKVGYGVPGVPDWTGPCVAAGVDRALARLGADVLDLVHLHSCPRAVLERGEVVRALEDAVRAGKVRVAAYSGDNDDAAYAVASGRFGALQISVSVVDRAALAGPVPRAAGAGMAVIAKRPLADAPWRLQGEAPADRPDLAEYQRRFRLIAPAVDPRELDWGEVALRFAAHQPGVSVVLTGTARLEHLAAAARWVARGPLDAELDAALAAAFRAAGGEAWPGII